MPALTKQDINSMLAFPCEIFVETGTHMGETTNVAKNMFEHVHTIEIVDNMFLKAKQRFSDNSNVTCHLGDSAIILKDVCKHLDKPTCFWLDGHYSGGNTGIGIKAVPLFEELQAIVDNCSKQCIVLIDDCRLFETDNDLGGWKVMNLNSILNIVKSRMSSYSFFPSALHPQDRLAIYLNRVQ